jgi:hypothetical protein
MLQASNIEELPLLDQCFIAHAAQEFDSCKRKIGFRGEGLNFLLLWINTKNNHQYLFAPFKA